MFTWRGIKLILAKMERRYLFLYWQRWSGEWANGLTGRRQPTRPGQSEPKRNRSASWRLARGWRRDTRPPVPHCRGSARPGNRLDRVRSGKRVDRAWAGKRLGWAGRVSGLNRASERLAWGRRVSGWPGCRVRGSTGAGWGARLGPSEGVDRGRVRCSSGPGEGVGRADGGISLQRSIQWKSRHFIMNTVTGVCFLLVLVIWDDKTASYPGGFVFIFQRWNS